MVEDSKDEFPAVPIKTNGAFNQSFQRTDCADSVYSENESDSTSESSEQSEADESFETPDIEPNILSKASKNGPIETSETLKVALSEIEDEPSVA